MAYDQWDTDERGDVKLCPVVGFQVAPAAETSVVVRIRFARKEEELRTGGEALQFVMTPTIANRLADDLRKAAERILSLPRPSPTN